MVRLGKGQAIIGGSSNNVFQAKIYSMGCSNRNCIISLLNRELSIPKDDFVAIPIPDTISGCITGGKSYVQKIILKSYTKLVQWIILQFIILEHVFYPQNTDNGTFYEGSTDIDFDISGKKFDNWHEKVEKYALPNTDTGPVLF